MNISREEVLRYLGYRGQQPDAQTAATITESILEIGSLTTWKAVFAVFDLIREGDRLRLGDSVLTLPGKDIERHLAGSERCAVLAATLGTAVDAQLARYSKLDLFRAVVLDAAASAAIEALCDETEEQIRCQAAAEGYFITSRYSPGYGDLPLQLQPTIMAVLDAPRRIGLTATASYLLLPRKSVTAFIGWRQAPDGGKERAHCAACAQPMCPYRKEETDLEP